MTTTMFLILLSAFSVISGLVTEAVKNVVSDKANLSYNIVALIVALIIGSAGTAVYYQLNEIAYTVNNIILNLIESNIYGSNIVESLSNQLSYLSDKILLDTKAKINKMPIKISLVSVFIFIPLILLIILPPLVINIVNNN